MQPTPAPSLAPNSPKAQIDVVEDTYPMPPFNTGTAPFSVLASLFDRLQTERKPERRRKLLNAWFNVCLSSCLLALPEACPSIGEKKRGTICIPSYVSFCRRQVEKYKGRLLLNKQNTERPRTCCVWAKGEEPCQDVHQTYPIGNERPRCSSIAELEETNRARCV